MEPFRRLEDLTLMDDYMFGMVMRDPKLLRSLLEAILDMHIRRVTYIEPQRTVKDGFGTKGVRLDLYVEDENGVVYNVEVQTTRRKFLPKRMRYYQSAIDMNVLSPGVDYAKLRKSFIIFICNHDPFDRNRIVYRFENRCMEEPDLAFGDETVKVIVNTRGTLGAANDGLLEIIRYLDNGTVSGEYSRELEDAVNHVKSSEERRHEYMIMMVREQELQAQAREEGREEGRLEGREEGRLEEREKLTRRFYEQLLAMNIPEEQARIMAFGGDEDSPVAKS